MIRAFGNRGFGNMYININLWGKICKKYAYSFSNFALWNPVASALEGLRPTLEGLRPAPWKPRGQHLGYIMIFRTVFCTQIVLE